jgi:hypothetical protein
MASPESNRHVFVIRIWREQRELKGALPVWRGVIEYVQNGDHRYLKHLDEIALFILPYLEKMGVQVETRWRLKQWLPWSKKSLTEADERHERD